MTSNTTTNTTHSSDHDILLSTRIRRKLLLLLLISAAIWLIQSSSSSSALYQALSLHQPSARIFRSIFEFNLIVLGTALSIHVWSRTIGVKVVQELLFFHNNNNNTIVYYQQQQDETDGLLVDNHHDEDEIITMRHQQHSETNMESRSTRHTNNYNTKNNKDENNEIMEDTDDEQPHPGLPSAESVLSAALDVLLVLTVTLFWFTLSASEFHDNNNNTRWISRLAAPIFPLLLFGKCTVLMLLKRRRSFWNVLFVTLRAPLEEVTFRDGFVGDILTSSVRPLQDTVFTVVYILYGLQGWWSESYFDTSTNTGTTHNSMIDTADARVLPVLEKSWWLHTFLLPLCAVSPLWWRFLQNLRQVYDTQQRWPYLGNALKYFCAAQVAVTGMFFPSWKTTSSVWLLSFVAATLYQVWWDVVMDWGLLEGLCSLRKDRLYERVSVYWGIAIVNCVLRFGWTLSFLPMRYLSASGVLTDNFTGDVTAVLNPLIASAEIIRRTLWGILRFEYEALRVCGASSIAGDRKEEQEAIELVPMRLQTGEPTRGNNNWSIFAAPMSSMSKVQILVELCAYAVCFIAIGVVAAVHRETL